MKILYWTQNPAAQNIMKQFNELGVDVEVFETKKDFLYLTDEDVPEADLLIFPSTHKSAANKKSLTIHATGNFGNADYGGESKKLNPTNPAAIAVGLRSMAKTGLEDFEICLEVTHHGPTLKTPLVFIEIGSTEKEWKDVEAGKIVANAIKEIIETLSPSSQAYHSEPLEIYLIQNPRDSLRPKPLSPLTNFIGFGGPHYAPGFTKLILENPNIAFGHILPKYQQENVSKEIIQQMVEGSNATKAVFDWDGMKGEYRNKAVEILEEIGVEWCKTGDLH